MQLEVVEYINVYCTLEHHIVIHFDYTFIYHHEQMINSYYPIAHQCYSVVDSGTNPLGISFENVNAGGTTVYISRSQVISRLADIGNRFEGSKTHL